MKTKLTLAAAALAASILQGCVAPSENALITSPSADGNYYCWENRLTSLHGKYLCNWETNARKACEALGWEEYLDAEAVVGEPVRLRRCENAQHIVIVRTRGPSIGDHGRARSEPLVAPVKDAVQGGQDEKREKRG